MPEFEPKKGYGMVKAFETVFTPETQELFPFAWQVCTRLAPMTDAASLGLLTMAFSVAGWSVETPPTIDVVPGFDNHIAQVATVSGVLRPTRTTLTEAWKHDFGRPISNYRDHAVLGAVLLGGLGISNEDTMINVSHQLWGLGEEPLARAFLQLPSEFSTVRHMDEAARLLIQRQISRYPTKEVGESAIALLLADNSKVKTGPIISNIAPLTPDLGNSLIDIQVKNARLDPQSDAYTFELVGLSHLLMYRYFVPELFGVASYIRAVEEAQRAWSDEVEPLIRYIYRTAYTEFGDPLLLQNPHLFTSKFHLFATKMQAFPAVNEFFSGAMFEKYHEAAKNPASHGDAI